jgi:hypothetical protein
LFCFSQPSAIMWRLASFCTHEIDSTPPATIDSPSPAMIALRGERDRLQPRRAEAVHGHAGDGHRAARAHRDLARDRSRRSRPRDSRSP